MSNVRDPEKGGMGPVPMPDIDLSTDTWTSEERAKAIRWYELGHGTGDTRLCQFVPFLIDYAPATFKRYRALVPNLTGAVPRGIFFVHLYAVIGNAEGCLYEIIACRRNGFTKQQIVDVLAYSFLAGGPQGINSVASLASPYLGAWEDDREQGRITWPEGWSIDPDVFRSGIDHYAVGMSDDETKALMEWHRKLFGEVPRYVELWARLRGGSYKANRARYEQATSSKVLPKQMYPLLTMHMASFAGQPEIVVESLKLAKALGGVKQGHIIEIMDTAFLQGGEAKMAGLLTDELIELIDTWDDV
jgi:alkylhydroperoxidase/carboxymuconolactone decarboxylase family protein YurZ